MARRKTKKVFRVLSILYEGVIIYQEQKNSRYHVELQHTGGGISTSRKKIERVRFHPSFTTVYGYKLRGGGCENLTEGGKWARGATLLRFASVCIVSMK
jgi:hypothetical protein